MALLLRQDGSVEVVSGVPVASQRNNSSITVPFYLVVPAASVFNSGGSSGGAARLAVVRDALAAVKINDSHRVPLVVGHLRRGSDMDLW